MVESLDERNLSAFINMPYDKRHESLYLAYIAGISGFGLIPRAAIEHSDVKIRLDKIIETFITCKYSFHDLSLVEKRYNMPFELGLAVAFNKLVSPDHVFLVFDKNRYLMQRRLSDPALQCWH